MIAFRIDVLLQVRTLTAVRSIESHGAWVRHLVAVEVDMLPAVLLSAVLTASMIMTVRNEDASMIMRTLRIPCCGRAVFDCLAELI